MDDIQIIEDDQLDLTSFVKVNEEEEQVIVNYLSELVKERLGASTITTGKEDNQLEYEIDTLSDAQLVSVLRWNEKVNTPKQDINEMKVLEMYRNGELESVLNKPTNLDDYSEDDLMLAKLKSDYPDLDEDELDTELEMLKQLPSYKTKVNLVKKQLEEILQQEEQEKLNKIANKQMDDNTKAVSLLNDVKGLYGFELDMDDKSEAKEFIMSGNFDKFLNTPDGKIQAALSILALPKIKKEFEKTRPVSKTETKKMVPIKTSDEVKRVW